MSGTATTNPEKQQDISVDNLSKKVQETTNEINQLKNGLNVYTIEEQDRRLTEIEESILDCTQDLQYLETETLSNTEKDELNKLKTKIDTLKSSKDQLKQQIERETKSAMDALSQEVAQSQSQEGSDKSEEKKETGKKILRVVGGVGIVAGTVALFRRIFGKKEDGDSKESRKERRKKRREERKSKPFWERPLGKVLKWTGIGTVAYYVAHGLKTGRRNPKDFFDWSEKGASKLTIKESLSVVAGEVNCGKIDENMFRRDFDKGIEYDEDNHLIKSYGESTAIDEKNKSLVGLEKVKFKDNIELVHAANIVNCLKHHLKGKGGAEAPFAQTGVGGDIQFCFSDKAIEVLSGSNTDLWKYVLGTTGVVAGTALGFLTKNPKVGIGSAIGLGVAGTLGGDAIDNNSSLGKCCSTIKDGDNFKRFIDYLNNLKSGEKSLWLPGKQEVEPDSKSPIQKYIREVVSEIESTNITETDEGKFRDLKAEQDPQNPNRYMIYSFGNSTYLTLNGSIKNDTNGQIDPSSIESITIESYTENDVGGELKLNFPHTAAGLKESIKVINLTNKIRKEYVGRGGEKYPIFYNEKNFFQGNTNKPSKYKAGLWIDTNGDGQTRASGQHIMTNETLSNYPTLLNDLKKSEGNKSNYFEDQLNGKKNGSSYLKYINGMRTTTSQNFWTQGQNV